MLQARVLTAPIHISPHIPSSRTLKLLQGDWRLQEGRGMYQACIVAARNNKGSFRAKRKVLDPIVVSSLDKATIDGIDAVGWVVERDMDHQRDLLSALS